MDKPFGSLPQTRNHWDEREVDLAFMLPLARPEITSALGKFRLEEAQFRTA